MERPTPDGPALLMSGETMRVVICGGGMIGACNAYIPREIAAPERRDMRTAEIDDYQA
jgi:hypothetical protein